MKFQHITEEQERHTYDIIDMILIQVQYSK